MENVNVLTNEADDVESVLDQELYRTLLKIDRENCEYIFYLCKSTVVFTVIRK